MIPPADTTRHERLRGPLVLGAAVMQGLCLILLAIDVGSELAEFDPLTILEAFALIGLLASVALTLAEYRALMRRTDRVERNLAAATGAFAALMDDQFTRWGLTAAERDVALMSVKGLSVADIAAMRHTAAGTVKAQSAAIYRKAGVSNRAEMISVLIEDLIDGVPLPYN